MPLPSTIPSASLIKIDSVGNPNCPGSLGIVIFSPFTVRLVKNQLRFKPSYAVHKVEVKRKINTQKYFIMMGLYQKYIFFGYMFIMRIIFLTI